MGSQGTGRTNQLSATFNDEEKRMLEVICGKDPDDPEDDLDISQREKIRELIKKEYHNKFAQETFKAALEVLETAKDSKNYKVDLEKSIRSKYGSEDGLIDLEKMITKRKERGSE